MMRSALFVCVSAALGACAPSAPPQGAFQSSAPSAGYTRVITPFTVLDENGQPYAHPLTGGFDVPRPQFIDIDGDGDYDLFVQERSNELMFFENVGTAKEAGFEWRTDTYQNLAIGEWNRFVDMDRDGDYDLLAEEPFSYIRYYRNEGTKQRADFRLAADSLRDDTGKPIFADRQNIPNLSDIDCDGQLDLFLGRVEGTLTRYEAVSARLDVPVFRFVTDRFEGIEIVAQIGGLSEPERSDQGVARPSLHAAVGSARHGANTMYWADVDNDGDDDLFWGDFFEPGVLLIRNVAINCQAPNLRNEPVPLTLGGNKLMTSGYNVPVLVDIDDDGDRDIFVGVLGGAYNPNLTSSDNFYFIEQAANGLELRTTRFIDAIDVGTESVPALGDLDDDGDLDLLIGNKLDPKMPSNGRLYLFTNTGTKQSPAFALTDTLDLAAAFHQAPALGDIDGDGDLDLLLGTWSEGVLVFRNEGTAQNARFVQDTAMTIRFTRGSNYSPTLVDIDADGDPDVLAGEASGELNLVRNIGTRTEPRFVLESEAWQDIDAGRRAAFTVVDMDGDGTLDLVAGSETAGSQFFRNEGTNASPRYVRSNAFSLPFHHLATPVFADIDGDGDLDLFTGSLSGGLVMWRRD